VLLESVKPKVAPAPVDPALERERLAYEMKKWEAEQEERRLEKEAKQRQKEEMMKWEADFEKMDWIVQCFKSQPTQYRLYGRRFLQVKRPNQQYQNTEGDATKEKAKNENN